ncbi:MAG TPA: hypothetical protein VJG90_00580 [Candidatus Nanoarchaeia archaeon]|nr:hypothetical protein [Candidatus Nanoarchaeia archaeon]
MSLDKRQQASIRKGIRLGAVFKEQHPDIANDYRSGKGRRQIVRERNLADLHEVPEQVAVLAITYALRGYDGRYPIKCKSYTGLIEDGSELERLASQHRAQGPCLRAAYFVQGKKCTPWDDNELLYLVRRSKEKTSPQDLAVELNRNFHGGVDVRTPIMVDSQLYNLRRPGNRRFDKPFTDLS